MDRFGFQLVGTTEEEERTRSRMAEAAEKLAKIPAWNKPGVFNLDISEECPTRKFKELVRQGIPTKLRPGLWLQLSGGLAMKKAAPADYFLNLAAFPGVMDPSAVRGFAHPQLTSQKGLSAVRRVVLAYGHHRGKGEISTNVTQLAAFLLAIFGLEKLEDVFWTLVGLENKLKPFSFCEDGGVNIEQRVLEVLMEKRVPKLAALLERIECPLSTITLNWCLTLFIHALPAETAVRVWDCMLCEGPKVVYRVALALLKINETAMLTTCHSVQLTRMLKWRAARTFDADALLRVAFKGIGTLKTESIKRARQSNEDAILAAIAARRDRLDAMLQRSKFQFTPGCSNGLTSIAESPIEMYANDRIVF